MIAVLLLAAAAGCGAIPPTHTTGRHVVTQHGSARFHDALQGAKDYCRPLGVKYLGTERSGQAISRFECVEAN